MKEKKNILAGKTIVVTGDLVYFPEPGPYPKREEFRELVESHGGKLTSAVSSKTSYLVCNNPHIVTVKVQQAKEKGVPLISEDEFLVLLTGKQPETRPASIDGQGKFYVENGVLTQYAGGERDVVVPSGVTDIGTIFKNNKLLHSITIPEGVTEIANEAFEFCNNLEDISIPRTVKRIGESAFAFCNNLRFINIPEGVEVIAAKAFDRLKKLRSVVIPSTVKVVGEEAFAWCENLTSLTLRDGIETINTSAFYMCTKLKQVSVPGSAQIGRRAFAQCEKLTSLELKPGITQMGEEAFFGCKQLRSVVIPEGITHVMPSTFHSCANLQNLSLPDSLFQICDYAFLGCTKLENVILPNNLQIISDGAFRRCSNLHRVDIPPSVRKINVESVFSGCRKMADENGLLILGDTLINIFETEPVLQIPEGITQIADYALVGAEKVKSQWETIHFPKSLYRIGEGFGWCSHLRKLEIPESVTAIEKKFLENSEIEMLSLPSNITRLPENALKDCGKLWFLNAPGISFEEIKERKLLIPATIGFLHNVEQYTPEQIAQYGRYAASQKQKIVPILLKKDDIQGITTYGNLKKIMPESFDEIFMQPALKANATQCIAYLLDWKNNHITAAMQEKRLMKELEKDPFDPKEMRKIWKFEELRDGTLNILFFKGKETDILVPPRIGKKPVGSIGPYALSPANQSAEPSQRKFNASIQKVVIGSGVQIIRKFAFRGCSALKSLLMGDDVKVVEKGAFSECTALENVVFSQGLREIGEEAFNCCWVQTLELPEGLEKLGAGAFRYCAGLHSVKIPSSLRRIGDKTFFRTAITTVDVPEGIESIGESAFESCSNLLTLRLPCGLKSLERAAFFGCSKLAQVEIPNGVETLGGSVFAKCIALERIQIPESVHKIGEYAFFSCPKLTIYAPVGSYAETYAKKNNIPFVAE